MAEKTWTAVDVQAGKVQLWVDADARLHIERPYVFIDVDTQPLPMGERLYAETTEWAEVPSSIRDALTAIDAYTRAAILTQEGMS